MTTQVAHDLTAARGVANENGVLEIEDDQNVPLAASAPLAAKLVKGSTLRIIPGAPHGMTATLKDQVNQELLAFIRA